MRKIVSWVTVFVAFMSIFIVEWYTPLHSDDYKYAMLGNTFDAHIHHYLTWSGRVVADYASTLLLASESRFIISAMTGLLVVAFCYFIVKTPTGTLRWKKHDTSIFALIFLTFWLSNPNIGQVVFWIVGSANYLWTNLFVVAWIWNLYRIHTQREEHTQIAMLILGLLAGCSNESIAPFVVGLAALAIVHDLWQHKKLKLNKCLYFVTTLIGASILIFCPGNYQRAKGEDWYHASLVEQVVIHLKERMPGHLALIWISYVILALLALILLYAQKKGFRFNKFNLRLVVLSMLIGIGTSFIMVASPSYPDRVVMSTFVFFLLAISFLARELLNTLDRAADRGVSAINVLLAGIFIWSYTLMCTAYIHVYQQDLVRLDIIEAQQQQHKREFVIPDFDFPRMQNRGGEFDFWHEDAVYGKYFGVQSIARKSTGVDYSIMVSSKPMKLNETTNAWFNGKGILLLVGAQPLSGSLKIAVDGKDINVPLSQFEAIQINEMYWYHTKIPHGNVTAISQP